MRTLHLAASFSAADYLESALRADGRDDEVLWHDDNLSCGPIEGDASEREAWLAENLSPDETIKNQVRSFWDRVTCSDDRLVVWFGRHSSMEHAFFLAVAERLGDRPYRINDVTGAQHSFTQQDGTRGLSMPAQAVALIPPDGLRALLTSSRSARPGEKRDASARWRQLRAENAPHRIVTDEGLVSVGLNYFDAWILACATNEWRKMWRVIGCVLGNNCEPYLQVGDFVLQKRIVDLVDKGVLLAEGNSKDMRNCRVRLPESI